MGGGRGEGQSHDRTSHDHPLDNVNGRYNGRMKTACKEWEQYSFIYVQAHTMHVHACTCMYIAQANKYMHTQLLKFKHAQVLGR